MKVKIYYKKEYVFEDGIRPNKEDYSEYMQEKFIEYENVYRVSQYATDKNVKIFIYTDTGNAIVQIKTSNYINLDIKQ